MSGYCIVENDVIVNIVEASAEYAASQGWFVNQGWGIGWVRSGGVFAPPEPQAPPEQTPHSCTRRQGLLALLSFGVKRADIEAQIEAIEDEIEREEAWIEYLANDWELTNPRLQQMWTALGGQSAQLVDLFRLAVTL